ncbi:hypothetical protein P4N68_10230 [Corynebacterium felinum]|uniref:Cytochrome b561 n=1 Tax=Corynebacterium felinum TaxID=131318 RepID=A0ABU2B5B7_9CORY|nr:hypothetical protein [Corynebacterium felinum]MDF5821449.1 hypothetical protein [Corynebacterium felinum]MDR7353800.1 cytochrome b561 [Corynebacterium felinum]WJY95979.1 hypothetical protein CFELI_11990 [Corynebacterium felinum]
MPLAHPLAHAGITLSLLISRVLLVPIESAVPTHVPRTAVESNWSHFEIAGFVVYAIAIALIISGILGIIFMRKD